MTTEERADQIAAQVMASYGLTSDKIREAVADAAQIGLEEDRTESNQEALKDIRFLWDWRVNKGMAFLASSEDVAVMRLLLGGTPLEKIPNFEWVAKARAEED